VVQVVMVSFDSPLLPHMGWSNFGRSCVLTMCLLLVDEKVISLYVLGEPTQFASRRFIFSLSSFLRRVGCVWCFDGSPLALSRRGLLFPVGEGLVRPRNSGSSHASAWVLGGGMISWTNSGMYCVFVIWRFVVDEYVIFLNVDGLPTHPRSSFALSAPSTFICLCLTWLMLP
jgi:hypothetical protein